MVEVEVDKEVKEGTKTNLGLKVMVEVVQPQHLDIIVQIEMIVDQLEMDVLIIIVGLVIPIKIIITITEIIVVIEIIVIIVRIGLIEIIIKIIIIIIIIIYIFLYSIIFQFTI